MRGILLLSGGIDSIALAHWLRPSHAITVDYGQRAAAKEREVSAHVARELGIEHQIVASDIRCLGSGSLAGSESAEAAPTPEWWPFRNQFLISLAAMGAVRAGVGRILIGTVSSDRQHADGDSPFIHAMQSLLRCQEGEVELSAPALEISSLELVRRSGIPRSLLASAHSCHLGNLACGRCRGCLKHEEVFQQLGLV